MDEFEVKRADDFALVLHDEVRGVVCELMIAQDADMRRVVSREVTPSYDGAKGAPSEEAFKEAYRIATEIAIERGLIDRPR